MKPILPGVAFRKGCAAILAVLMTASILAGCSSSSASSAAASSPAASAAPAAGAPTPSAGCTAATAVGNRPAVTNLRQNITVDGAPRWYLLNEPARGRRQARVPRPLVLDFHGLAEGATLHTITTRFGVLGQKDGFDAVFPNGTGTPVQWNTGAQAHNADLDFVSAMLDHLESAHCIDTSRVYASGFSDGSFFVSLLACTMSNRFAAIAAVSGLQLDKPCHTGRKIPILTFHGTADPILYFNGGIGIGILNRILGKGGPPQGSPTTTTTLPKANLHGSGYPATVKAWAKKDGCGRRSTDGRISSQVILRRYECPAGSDVEFYIILGGGHAWPGSKFSQQISSLTGYTTFQINATNAIWSFFRRFKL